MPSKFTLEDWVGETLTAAYDMALTSLGRDHYKVRGAVQVSPPDCVGAYIPLVSGDDAVMIGLITDKRGCQELAKYFIQPDAKTDLAPEDAVDSIREMLNILTGVLKRRIVERHPVVKTGLPVFTEGVISPTPGQEAICVQVEVGDVTLYVRVIRSDTIAAPKPTGARKPPEETLSLNVWLDQLLTAAFRVAPLTLGKIRDLQFENVVNAYPSGDLYGAYMPLIGEQDAVLVGLLSDRRGFLGMIQTFLGGEEYSSPEDMADAGKEILNILTGMVKRQMAGQNMMFKIGLPVFMIGFIEVSEGQESACAQIQLQEGGVHLVIIRKSQTRPAAA